jgi:AraC-like DNA-binding protein
MSSTIFIKNMVCPRCIASVEAILKNLKIDYGSVTLGQVNTPQIISTEKKEVLNEVLLSHGFELLEDSKSKIINKIKGLIVDEIHYKKDILKVNFSSFIAEELDQEYTSLSKLFSSVEGITIERFILKQKIEKVKELLFYNQLTLSEIAFQLNYSSTAHLSSQFKKETGLTPTQFKNIRKPLRKSLDQL